MKSLQNNIFFLIKLLYPDKCPVCDKALPRINDGFCPGCKKNMQFLLPPLCEKCGRPAKVGEKICSECSESRHFFDGGRCVFPYSYIQSSIYRFKYMKRPDYAKAFGKAVTEYAGEWLERLEPDALIPVPLYKKRLIQRGYNQAEELAKAISEETGIPCKASVAARIKNTVMQKYFDKKHRQINLKKAFLVRESVVKLDTVVIVDDIFTTGSTIDSLALELKDAGVKNVFFLALAAAGT